MTITTPMHPPTHTHTHTHTHSEVYESGQRLCETLWGESFLYSNYSETDGDRQCMTLTPWNLTEPNPNEVALANIFGSLVNKTEPPTCGASSMGVWSALVSIVMALVSTMLF